MENNFLRIDEYLKIKEAAEFIGVTPNTLRNWEMRGIIKVYRDPFSNYRLYNKEDLSEILNNIKPSGNNDGK